MSLPYARSTLGLWGRKLQGYNAKEGKKARVLWLQGQRHCRRDKGGHSENVRSYGFDKYFQCGLHRWVGYNPVTAHRPLSPGPGVAPPTGMANWRKNSELLLYIDSI